MKERGNAHSHTQTQLYFQLQLKENGNPTEWSTLELI